MVDRLTKEQRHRNMTAIRGQNTKPEIEVRKLLHRLGYRYKLHDRTLPGTPDIVLPRFRAVVMVHGCFWHLHGCSRTTIPETRRDFWLAKLESNRARDKRKEEQLRAAGWNVVTVWECELDTPGVLAERLKVLLPKNI